MCVSEERSRRERRVSTFALLAAVGFLAMASFLTAGWEDKEVEVSNQCARNHKNTSSPPSCRRQS